MKYTLEKEQKEAERKVIEAQGRANAIETINKALAQNPNYIRYLYVDKLSDKISVIVSDQNTIMDLKGVLEGKKYAASEIRLRPTPAPPRSSPG